MSHSTGPGKNPVIISDSELLSSISPTTGDSFYDDEWSDLEKWYSARRTTWPQPDSEFLPKSHLRWAAELAHGKRRRLYRTTLDYAWVPDILAKIFSKNLNSTRKFAILRYFLSFLSELILVDVGYDSDDATVIRHDISQAIEPASFGLLSKPPFLGILKPLLGSDPVELELVELIGNAVAQHLKQDFI
jgi:hypothetical protein